MVFSLCDWINVQYCYNCLHGPEGCMVPSRHNEGTDIRACNEEIEAKLRSLQRKQHLELESELEQDRQKYGANLKILILGGPSSGKSTIFKQMQIIHVDGFKQPQELLSYRSIIDTNIRDIYLQLIAGSRLLKISLEPIEHILFDVDDFYRPMANDDSLLRTNQDLADSLTEFWKTEQVQELFRRRCEFELMDSTKYYFDNLHRIAKEDYLPDESDIVHSRKATMSLNSIVFEYTGVSLHMIDVGGQRSERKKWLHLFDDAKVVLFVIDLTGFAKKSEESRMEVSRFPRLFSSFSSDAFDMKVALKIFHDVVNSKALATAVFLLFFNKVDLFQELLSQARLDSCFSKYDGQNNYEETSQYICDKFVRAARPKNSVFPHFTTATNTENVKLVFRACMESVFKANSKATGLS